MLAQHASDDPLAFLQLYDRCCKQVYGYFSRRTEDRHTAEDLTSQLFLKLLNHLRNQPPQTHFGAWIFVIARNLVNDHYRSCGKQNRLYLKLLNDSRFDSHSGWPEDGSCLQAALSELNAEEQELLTLRYAVGMSFEEIGSTLSRTPVAVKSHLYRVQEKLRACLENDHE